MKPSQFISLLCCVVSATLATCAAAQISGGVGHLLYLDTLGWSGIALGAGFIAWPHGYKHREEDTLPAPPGIHGKQTGKGRQV